MARVPVRIRQRLTKAMPKICAQIPANKRVSFEKAVVAAVGIYLDIVRPKAIPDELRRIASAVKDPNADPRVMWPSVSDYTQTIVRQFDNAIGPLPSPSSASKGGFRKALSVRVLQGRSRERSGRWHRSQDHLISDQGRGRPEKKKDLEVLVSYLAAGYAAATGKPVTKKWSIQIPDRDTPFESVLAEVFKVVGVPDNPRAVKRALEYHMKARKKANRNKFNIL